MKFAYTAALISAAYAASLPYCPLPEPAPPAETPAAPVTTSVAPPAASSAAPAPSTDFKVGDVIGIITTHSGDVNVHLRPVGLNTDNKLGIDATSGDLKYVLEKGYNDGEFQVKIQDTDKYLTLYSGYLETQPSQGNDFVINGNTLSLAIQGNKGFIVCPSDGNTIKYSSDNCADPVGVNLYISKL